MYSSFLLNIFLEVEFQSEYCYSFNAVVNLHNVFSNSHTDPHSHQQYERSHASAQFSSNGFCWVLCCFTWDKDSFSVRPSFLSLPSVRMASVSQHCLPLLLSHNHTLGLRWCLPVVWVIISRFVHGPNAHLSIFLYGIKGSSLCFPTLDLLLTDPLSQAWHTWSPQTFPSPVSFFPNCYFVIQMGMVVFLLPEQFAE